MPSYDRDVSIEFLSMAKYKATRRFKEKADTKTSILRALPCLLLIVIGIALFSLLFYSMMKSA
jgi:hypothetical protein